MRFRELFGSRAGCDDLCRDVIAELSQHRGHIVARKDAHGLQPLRGDFFARVKRGGINAGSNADIGQTVDRLLSICADASSPEPLGRRSNIKRRGKSAAAKTLRSLHLRRTAEPLPKLREGGAGPFQPSRSERRTAAPGQYALALITRTHVPFERSTRACEQISCSISVTSISVVGLHCNVLGTSPGQMRQAEPSPSSTIRLLSCFLICMADVRAIESEPCMYRGARALYVSGAMYQGRRDPSHPARLLE